MRQNAHVQRHTTPCDSIRFNRSAMYLDRSVDTCVRSACAHMLRSRIIAQTGSVHSAHETHEIITPHDTTNYTRIELKLLQIIACCLWEVGGFLFCLIAGTNCVVVHVN